jgi:transcriptional regulator with XRE-family HTH domain
VADLRPLLATLRAERIRRQILQKQMCRRVGYSHQPQMSRIEQGVELPSMPRLLVWAQALEQRIVLVDAAGSETPVVSLDDLIATLAAARSDRGWSLAAAGRAAECEPTQIASWERAQVEPKLASLARWAGSFGWRFDVRGTS